MNVSLAPELEQFVTEQVKSGKYRSSAEVISEALKSKIQETEQLAFQQRLTASRQQAQEGKVVEADSAFFEGKRQRIKDQYLSSSI